MKSILDFFNKSLDLWEKFSSRLRSLGYLIAVIFAVMFLINNGCKRQQIEELVEKTTGLNIKNDILKKTNKNLQNKIENKDSIILSKNLQIDSISKKFEKQNGQIWYWKSKYADISDELNKISSDSTYKVTQQIYNYPGVKKYPYNSRQVTGIYRTYLENKNRKEQLSLFEMSLHDCQQQIALMEDVNSTMQEKFMLKENQLDNTEEIISNKDEEIELLNKHLQRNRKWFAGFGVGPTLGITYMEGSVIPYVGIGIHYNLYKW